jgi:hypothetical protein
MRQVTIRDRAVVIGSADRRAVRTGRVKVEDFILLMGVNIWREYIC